MRLAHLSSSSICASRFSVNQFPKKRRGHENVVVLIIIKLARFRVQISRSSLERAYI